MIISHKHRFIFIKTLKTASTSVEIALSSICGADDVITPITEKDEAVRHALGYPGPQNYQINERQAFFNHMSAVAVRRIIGEDIWAHYYSFCVERNPWDKVLSWYHWERQFNPEMTFDSFMRSGHFKEVEGVGGFDLYTDCGRIIVDKVCLYEQLDVELAALMTELDIEALPALPHVKTEFRDDRRPYEERLSRRHYRAIRKAFKREASLFGYTA